MKFKSEIKVMPRKELLDPQGKAVALGLKNIGVSDVNDVRIGKHIVVYFESENYKEAEEKIKIACNKLLTNTVVEYFEYEIEELK